MKQVLIVEDEPKVAKFIQRGLAAEGFQGDIAPNGPEALRMASEHTYDVITVDLMLPGVDGYSVIENLRKKNTSSGILILSAKDTLEDKLHGFKVGSDDYLPKPFAFEELLARINALIRRQESVLTPATQLSFEDLSIDLTSRQVRRGKRVIELTNTEFRLLEYLMRNVNTPCSRAKIAANVWNEHFDRETNIVDVYMMYLRKKVDAYNEPPYIHTVRGIGYVLKSSDPKRSVAA